MKTDSGSNSQKARPATEPDLQRIRVLYEIGLATTSALDLQTVLEILLQKFDLLLPPHTVTAVKVHNKETGELEIATIRHFAKQEWSRAVKQGCMSYSETVFKSKAPLIIGNVQTDSRTHDAEFFRQHHLVSHIGFPLIVRHDVLGVISFFTREEHHFSDEEVKFLSMLTGQLALAIHNSQLHERSRKREEVQTLLKELSQDITSLDIESLLKKLTNRVCKLLAVDLVDVRMLAAQSWQVKGVSGIDPAALPPTDLMPQGRSEWIVRNRVALMIPDITEAEEIEGGNTLKTLGVLGYLGIPIFSRKREVIGVLRALSYKPRKFTQDEIDLLQQLANEAAIALENARLYEQAQRREEIQRLLKELSQDITSLDIEPLLNKLTSRVCAYFNADASDIRLSEGGRWVVKASTGIDPTAYSTRRDAETARGTYGTGWVVKNRRPLIIQDTRDPEGAHAGQTVKELGFRGYLGVPIIARSAEVIGSLRLLTFQPREFTKEEVDLLQQLANGAAVAIENAKLFDEIQQKSNELEALVKINRDIAMLLDQDTLLPRIAEEAKKILKMDSASFRLIEGEYLVVSGSVGSRLERRPRLPLNSSLSGKLIRENRTLAIKDISKESSIGSDRLKRLSQQGYRSFLGAPLQIGGRVIGIINLYSKAEKDFTRDEIELINRFADQAAIAVENARLYEQTKRQTVDLDKELSERKRAQSLLAQQSEELALSNTELEQFSYVVSHDLQEPLRMVSSYVQLLAKRYHDKLDSDANDFINYATDGAHRMKRLINDLLEYSRVTTRGKTLKFIDAEVILNRAFSNLQVAIQESNAVVTYDPLPSVLGDETQLLQLLQNLIGNAIKFCVHQSPKIHISAQKNGESQSALTTSQGAKDNKLEIRNWHSEEGDPQSESINPKSAIQNPKSDEWLFSVHDNGIGIAPQDIVRVFTVFQRLHDKENYPGTGIGLSICKKIVERHGGRIWVESQPGEGSTFYFTIPCAQRGEQP